MTGVIPGIKVDQAGTPPGAFCCPPLPPPPPPPCWFGLEGTVSIKWYLSGNQDKRYSPSWHPVSHLVVGSLAVLRGKAR